MRSQLISEHSTKAESGQPVIVVHSLAQAIAGLSAAARVSCPVVLVSAPDAGGYLGPGWFGALVAAAREAVPDVRCSSLLDCGDSAGTALAAIRAEVEGVIFTGRPDVARRLADIARQHGVRFETKRSAGALDLVEDFFTSPEDVERRCAEFLGYGLRPARRIAGAPLQRAPRCRPSSSR